MSKRGKRRRNEYGDQPYMKRVSEMVNRGDISVIPGSVSKLTVRHDDWCELLKGKGGLCNCQPEVEIQRLV